MLILLLNTSSLVIIEIVWCVWAI